MGEGCVLFLLHVPITARCPWSCCLATDVALNNRPPARPLAEIAPRYRRCDRVHSRQQRDDFHSSFCFVFSCVFFTRKKSAAKRGENSGFCFVFLFSAAGFWELRGAAWCSVAWAAPAGAARMCHPCKSGSCAPGGTPNVLLSMQILPPRQRRRQSAISSRHRLQKHQNTSARRIAHYGRSDLAALYILCRFLSLFIYFSSQRAGSSQHRRR